MTKQSTQAAHILVKGIGDASLEIRADHDHSQITLTIRHPPPASPATITVDRQKLERGLERAHVIVDHAEYQRALELAKIILTFAND